MRDRAPTANQRLNQSRSWRRTKPGWPGADSEIAKINLSAGQEDPGCADRTAPTANLSCVTAHSPGTPPPGLKGLLNIVCLQEFACISIICPQPWVSRSYREALQSAWVFPSHTSLSRFVLPYQVFQKTENKKALTRYHQNNLSVRQPPSPPATHTHSKKNQ